MLNIHICDTVQDLSLGVIQASGLCIGESSIALRAACDDAVRLVREHGMAGGEPRREAVRRMLRAGGFRPAGRNKPAQEYLLRTASESQSLPTIFNAVDLLNMVSLKSGLPISLLARSRFGATASVEPRVLQPPVADAASSVDGSRVMVRYGTAGEKFVFNRAGQELELEGLICVCCESDGTSHPLGTPIKDSMAGKIGEHDHEVVAFIYAPRPEVAHDELLTWCNELGNGFLSYCDGASFEVATGSSV